MAASSSSLSSQVVPPFRPVGLPGAKVLHESLLERRKEGKGEKKKEKKKKEQERKR